MKRDSRLAYSTETGGVCSRCGRPRARCRCALETPSDEPVPAKMDARLRLEKSGRRGKTVTVVEGLPANRAFLDQLAGELRKACGSGGTAGRRHVEIQGDHRDRIGALLRAKGWTVRG